MLVSKLPEIFYPIEAIIVTAFSICVEKLTDLKNSKLFVMAFIILQPICVYKEIISWMSAFINYLIPIAFFVFTMVIVKNNLLSKSKLYSILLILFGFCEQLFIEHNTIINILFISVILVYGIKKHLGFIKESVILLASNIIGAGVMFLYNFYIDYSKTYTASFAEPYRKTILSDLSSDRLKGAVIFAAKNIQYPFIMFGSSLFLISVLFITMFYVEKRQQSRILSTR